jgi:hypothetical protein
MPGGTLLGSLLFCSLSPRQKRSRSKSWTKVLALLFKVGRTHTHPVFSVPTYTHAAYQIKALPHNIKKYIFRMQVDPLPPLYEHEGAIGEKHYAPGGAGHA